MPKTAPSVFDDTKRAPVAVVEIVEDLLVARLAPERVHRPDARQRLGEMHDDQRHRLPRGAVRVLGPAAEPPRERDRDREHGQHCQRELPVEHEQHDGDAADEQHRVDEVDETLVEQLGERLDVAAEPRLHTAGRVALVEREAELLEVVEDAAAQVEENVLADASRSRGRTS